MSQAQSWSRKNIRPLFVISFEMIMRLLFSLPRFKLLNALKAYFLVLVGAKIGQRVVFYPGVWIIPGSNLVIGDDVDLALDVLITTAGGVTIGDRTLIGYRTQILSSNHKIPANLGKIFGSGHDARPVKIGNDVWIGGNCLILPGVSIGEGAVVAGGSVVTRDVAPWNIVAGVPARQLKSRLDNDAYGVVNDH